MKNESEDTNMSDKKKQSRIRFLVSGFSLAAAFLFKWGKRNKRPTTIKFLSEDGRLVEVDISKLHTTGRQASKAEIQNWVKR